MMNMPPWAEMHPASHWHKLNDTRIQCSLTPRGCKVPEGKTGFCGVRMNMNGAMVALNYGRAVGIVEEMIETEAVNHYMPGSKILCIGNIGCMMNCDFCQNWKTSQVEFIDPAKVHAYTPEMIVDTALRHGIGMLSWTYNDPIVWHEFVMDTARLARQHGIKNLYKSAFYISEEAAYELAEVIDVFSISLKSMDNEFYVRRTKAQLPPVLERIKLIASLGNHLEISNLLVTDLNESEKDVRAVARWIMEHCPPGTALHFVRFHPDYKYMHTDRTPPERLFRAREIAKEEGIDYCYIGNLYVDGAADTLCPSCDQLLIKRFGSSASIVGLDDKACCTKCGRQTPIIMGKLDRLMTDAKSFADESTTKLLTTRDTFRWNEDVNCAHIVVPADQELALLNIERFPSGEKYKVALGCLPGLHRHLIARTDITDSGFVIHAESNIPIDIFPILDRAHFSICGAMEGESPPDPNVDISK